MERWSGSGSGHCETMRTGILGGTFDPVHLGHLIVAQEVMERLGLAEVRFVPASQPWMKSGRNIASAEDRLRMLQLSLEENPHLVIDNRDLKRPGASYTIDTLKEMRKDLGPDVELFFILGVDALRGFPSWKDPGEIIKLCTLVVAPRPGYRLPNVAGLEARVPGIKSRSIILEGPRIGISAEGIRERVHQGKSLQYLVAPAVDEYIKEHRLYQLH